MKKIFYLGIILSLLLISFLSGCGSSGGGNPGGGTPTPTPIVYTPGQSSTCTVGSGAAAVSFKMNYAPSGSFPSDDDAVMGGPKCYPTRLAVANAYWIAQTDVTYQLWSAVYTWATTTATYKYNFTEVVGEGNSNLQPVTVSWRDAMLWCNALTEYYNATNGTNLACVYTINGLIVRDSTVATNCDNAIAVSTAKGFRLPTSSEWELAARYQDGTNWTPGDHVSGDSSGYCYQNTPAISPALSYVFGDYAWYSGNCSSIQPVATTPQKNALGLYDMCGNVWQWCFDCYPYSGSSRVARGGSYYDSYGVIVKYLQLGFVGFGSEDSPGGILGPIGFRPVRTQ